jgi:hypothetical protein
MFMRRLCIAVPIAIGMYPRKAQALQIASICKTNYREHFDKLNVTDENNILASYREELTKEWGFPQVIATLDEAIITELHYIHVLDLKPLSAKKRISLRKFLLPFLENIEDKEKHEFFLAIAKYYDVL